MSIRSAVSIERLLLRWAATGLALALCAPVSFAVPITWTLNGIVFNDGGTAMGSFSYDAATNTLSDIMITTTPGSIRSGATYTSALDIMTAPEEELSFITPPPPIQENASQRLTIMLDEPLSDAGGTIDIAFVTELTCLQGLGCSFFTGSEPGLDLRFDFPSEGFVTTLPPDNGEVPEPAALTLLGLGLLIFAVWRRRKPRDKERRQGH